jgi:hypothetical protein
MVLEVQHVLHLVLILQLAEHLPKDLSGNDMQCSRTSAGRGCSFQVPGDSIVVVAG